MRHGRYRIFKICPGTGEHWARGVFEPVSPSTRRATVEPAPGDFNDRCCFWERVQFQPVLRHLLPPPLQNVAKPICVESYRGRNTEEVICEGGELAVQEIPTGLRSFSPGLRGTSYPGTISNEDHNPERVESPQGSSPLLA